MAIVVYSSQPDELLTKLRTAIEKQLLPSWEADSNGDFTRSDDQGVRRAWFCPSIVSGMVIFTLLKHDDVIGCKPICAVYHGLFIEMLLKYFYADFANIMIAKD